MHRYRQEAAHTHKPSTDLHQCDNKLFECFRAEALKEYRKELVRLEKDIGIDYHKAAFKERQQKQIIS